MKFKEWYKQTKSEPLEEQEKHCHNAITFSTEITSLENYNVLVIGEIGKGMGYENRK